VYSKRKKEGYESKSVCNGNHCNLYNFQVTKHKQWLIERPAHKLYWVFWRHSLVGIHKFIGTEPELFKELSKRTSAAICVPFSIVFQMWVSGGIIQKAHANSWLGCSDLPSTTCNRFLTDPTDVILGFGLSSKKL